MAMTLDEYRIQCGWSQTEMARNCGIDFNTLKRALNGENISTQTARKIAGAISQALGRTIHFTEIKGLNVNL
jgi:transcriptional regulator with XRE-family HTH domain